MCGILWSSINKNYDLEFIKKQFEKIKHRGPDNSGFVTHDDEYFMGTHRLAITNLSDEGNQPFTKNKITLICNGQIYNANKLITDQHLRSDVDIFTILYEKYSKNEEWTKMMGQLDGDFAAVLLDLERNRLFIARDPVGVRPLFYCLSNETNELIAIASEAKSLEEYPDSNVFVFPPYTYCSVDLNKRDALQFVSYREILTNAIKPDKMHETIVSVLSESVYKRIDETDQPVAFLLSGGIDSAIISCIANEYLEKKGRKMHCFCMKFRGDRSDDFEYASLLASLMNVDFTIVEFDWKDVLDNLENIIYQIESYDPNTIRASIPMYLLCKYLRENTPYKVFLSGEGADELFAGYFYFNYCEDGDNLNKETERLVKNIHMFDVLRADRCFTAHGLEVRVPFLDKTVVETVFSIQGDHKKFFGGTEKHLLRECFKEKYPVLQKSRILERVKERFSDGVSFQYVPRLLNHFCNNTFSQIIN